MDHEDSVWSKSLLEDGMDAWVDEWKNQFNPSAFKPAEFQAKYFDPAQNDEYQKAKKTREESALKRNQFGEVLYSEACSNCTEHYHYVDTCNLCGTVWPYSRQHVSVMRTEWTDELIHDCYFMRNFLKLILKAVVYG